MKEKFEYPISNRECPKSKWNALWDFLAQRRRGAEESNAETLWPSCLCVRQKNRAGVTLIVTLGILTLLSVLIIGFFVSSRLNRQAGASDQHRITARNQIEEAVSYAMRTIEQSMAYPNYMGDFIEEQSDAFTAFDNRQSQRRVAPIGPVWFTEEYCVTNQYVSTDLIAFQAENVLASPTWAVPAGATNVNLLTPQVLRLLPPALTNSLAERLRPGAVPPFRSGWYQIDPFVNASVDLKLLANPTRIAFVAINCSSLVDANHFGTNSLGAIRGPTSEKRASVCFSQADVTNWVNGVQGSSLLENLDGLVDYTIPEESPFGYLSYDPGPDVYPLSRSTFETSFLLGLHRFNAQTNIDLNQPGAYQLLQAGYDACYSKFNINSITNADWGCQTQDASGALTAMDYGSTPWYNNAEFRTSWLDPVTALLDRIRAPGGGNSFMTSASTTRTIVTLDASGETFHRIDNTSAFAWAIANQIDADRVPKVSEFPTPGNPEPDINNYTRADFAVKDVPLINKVRLFSLFDRETGATHPDCPIPNPASYYSIETPPDATLSNHYAAAIELWFPFAPGDPPPDAWCYVGIVTNAADAVTTTNRPWSSGDLRDMYDWMNAGTTNNLTLMQLLFRQWSQRYRDRFYGDYPVTPYRPIYRYSLTNGVSFYKHSNIAWGWDANFNDHPLWRNVTEQKDLWFTDAMTSHPSWPQDNPDLSVEELIKGTLIWQSLYPESADGYVVDGVYTNFYIAWVPVPDGLTADPAAPPPPPPPPPPALPTNRLTGISNPALTTPITTTLRWGGGDTSSTQLLSADTDSGSISFGLHGPQTRTLLNLAMDHGDDYLTITVATGPPRISVYTNYYEDTTIDLGNQNNSQNIWWEVHTNAYWDVINTYKATALYLSDGTTTNVASTAITPLPPPDGTLGTVTNATGAVGALLLTFREDEPLPILPWDQKLYEELDTLFEPLLQMKSLEQLQEFLMTSPDSDDWGNWADYFLDYFNDNLSSINRILRSHTVPGRVGGERGKNYISLDPISPFFDPETVMQEDLRQSEDGTYGVYWTIYPRVYQCFPEHEIIELEDPEGRKTGESVTNYNWVALGQTSEHKIWVNPAVSIEGDVCDHHSGNDRVGWVYLNDGETAGVITDEALLSLDRENLEFPPMWWSRPGYCTVPDPRRNAWWHQWERCYIPDDLTEPTLGQAPHTTAIAEDDPNDVMLPSMEYSWGVKELPFIQLRTPFRAIGEIGHTYYPYANPYIRDENGELDTTVTPRDRNALLKYDTDTFSTRSGAAQLDTFTVAPESKPRYGLVQANTALGPVVKTLLSDIPVGWTNTLGRTTDLLAEGPIATMTDIYTNAVTYAPFSMGWRSFADMMPMLLATNRFSDDLKEYRLELDVTRLRLEEELKSDGHPLHDYMEDITRGLIDKVSFRQNVYMVVVAAQTLSRTSSPNRPIVLADQRALVTVIRDAWSGRWVIHDWQWLTE